MQNNQEQCSALWSKITGLLCGKICQESYERWFPRLVLVEDTGTHLILASDDEMCLVWVESNYANLIQEAALLVLEGPRLLEFRSLNETNDHETEAVEPEKTKKLKTAMVPRGKSVSASLGGNLNPNYTFENFVVGQSNQFAHAVSFAVASSDTALYNPLFIHGGSGLGKTHLMQAIGNEILRRRPELNVLYLSCEQFLNEFVDSIQTKRQAKFRNKYRKVDVLLVDDVQFLGGNKGHTREEFFHTFNILFNDDKQIVLSSDRPASEISNLEPRLTSRFESGMTVEVQSPNMETRMAILRQKRQQWKVNVSDDILMFLAEHICRNIRRLEGGLMRIATFASLSGDMPNLEHAQHLLRDILSKEISCQITIEAIQRCVSSHFDIRMSDMSSKRRPASIAFPRQIAMYLSRQLTQASLQDIGAAFGGRDHGTVIHANKTIESKIASDTAFKTLIESIQEELYREEKKEESFS